MTEAVQEVRRERDRCPYCHDEIGVDLPRLACNTCTAWHHEACWVEGGGKCSTCGADATGTSAPAKPRSQPSATRLYNQSGFWYYVGLPFDLVWDNSRAVGFGLLGALLLGGAARAIYLLATGQL